MKDDFEYACKVARANAYTFRRPYSVYRVGKSWRVRKGRDGAYTAEPEGKK